MTKLVLAGHAVTADILAQYLRRDARFELVAATVDDEFVEKGGVDGLRTVPLSALEKTCPAADHVIMMAMGYSNLNQDRASLFERLKALGYRIETYVHPDAHVYTQHPIGEGSIVLPGAVVEPHVTVGSNTMIWCNVTVAHHASVADHCWLASGAVISGQARVGNNCFVGVNATIVNGLSVGDNSIVGASALVTKDVKPSTVHLARSAEPIRFSSQDYAKYFGV